MGGKNRLATVPLGGVSCPVVVRSTTSGDVDVVDGDLRVHDDQGPRAVAGAHVPPVGAMEDQLRELGGTSGQREDQDS